MINLKQFFDKGLHKILVTMILMCMMFTYGTVITSAADAAKIRGTSCTAERGDTVSVSINLENNPGIWGLKLRIQYNDSALTLKSVNAGNVFKESELTLSGELNKNPYIIVALGSDLKDKKTSGSIVTLEFKVSEEADYESYPVNIEVSQAINMDREKINVSVDNGSITVEKLQIQPPFEEPGGDNVIPKEDGFGVEDVYRIMGKDRYETAFKAADALKAQLKVEKFDTVIVACGTKFADALSGSYLASKTNAPILLVDEANRNELVKYVTDNLAENGKIYILGGTAAVSENVERALNKCGTLERLYGETRYETNQEILKEAEVDNEDMLICTGNGFADSLSASALKRPILLVDKSLSKAQKKYLKTLSGNRYYIIGGDKAVNTAIEAEISNYDPKVKRLGGETRYETSVLVAEEFFEKSRTAVLAYAQNFPDGLSGGPLAMSKDAPLILTASDSYGAAEKYVKSNGISKGAVLGGEILISDKVANKIFGSNKITIWP